MGMRIAASLLENVMFVGGKALAAPAGTQRGRSAAMPGSIGAAAVLDKLGPALPSALVAAFCSTARRVLAALPPPGSGGGSGDGGAALWVLLTNSQSVLKMLKWMPLAPSGAGPVLDACLKQSMLPLLAEMASAAPALHG